MILILAGQGLLRKLHCLVRGQMVSSLASGLVVEVRPLDIGLRRVLHAQIAKNGSLTTDEQKAEFELAVTYFRS